MSSVLFAAHATSNEFNRWECYERLLDFLEVFSNALWNELLRGFFQSSDLDGFKCRTLESSACPLWACTYSMSFTNSCKGQHVCITGENYFVCPL